MIRIRHIIVSSILITVVVLLTIGRSFAGDHPFRAEYAGHEVVLRKQYFTNIRTKTSVIAYNDSKRDGSLVIRLKFTTITDGKSCRSDLESHRIAENLKRKGSILWYGFEAYNTELQPDSQHTLVNHKSSAKASPQVDGMLHSSFIFAPLSYKGDLPFLNLIDVMTEQNDTRGYHFAVESVTRVRRKGYDAVQVITSSGSPPTRTTAYLDAGNHMAFREYESDGVFDIPTRSKLPIKQAGELTYTPGPEGYPIPKEYKEWFVHPDGRKVPKVTVTWEEFARYTPAADDFDLEKQFGIKRLPPPAGLSDAMLTGRAGRSWRWLYAVAAVLALVTGGLVVIARRRRSAAPAPDPGGK
jgi:hypothetical protein